MGKIDSNTITAQFGDCASTVHQQLFSSHFGYGIFRLVADINVSDIGSVYRQQQQRHAPCCILKNSVNGALTMFSLASWAIYIPIGCRHLFIRYRKPLLGKNNCDMLTAAS
jgi:hypothetical protein